jgi:hypothetical protein
MERLPRYTKEWCAGDRFKKDGVVVTNETNSILISEIFLDEDSFNLRKI